MPATATELFEQISPPAEILDVQQFRERSQTPGDGTEDSHRDRVRRARKSLGTVRELRAQLAGIQVETDDERAAIQKAATEIGGFARGYYDLRTELIEDGYILESHPLIGLVEDIAVELEDIAESMALAGSAAFARLVERELTADIPVEEPDDGT